MKSNYSLCAFFFFSILIFSCNDDKESMEISSVDEMPFSITNLNLEALSHSPLPFTGGFVSDVFGYYDSLSQTEYAIVGHYNPPGGNVAIFEIDSEGNSTIISTIKDVKGFDIKVWRHYLYIGNGGPGNFDDRSLIYDLTDPINPQLVGDFPPCHNLTISDNGYLILSGSLKSQGMMIMDLNANPTNPSIIWKDARTTDSHDASVIGDRLYDFHASETIIYDFSNPTNPIELGIVDDDRIGYHHSGWATEDGNTLFLADEGSLAFSQTADITIWDISVPSNPLKISEISDLQALGHNIYLKDDLAFIAYYGAGFKLFDVSDPLEPVLLGQFDTAQAEEKSEFTFSGAFGVFPYTNSGYIYVSDMIQGLYVLKYQPK